ALRDVARRLVLHRRLQEMGSQQSYRLARPFTVTTSVVPRPLSDNVADRDGLRQLTRFFLALALDAQTFALDLRIKALRQLLADFAMRLVRLVERHRGILAERQPHRLSAALITNQPDESVKRSRISWTHGCR